MNIIERLEELERTSKNVGFYWPDFASCVKQIADEVDEVNEAFTAQEGRERLQEELGDLLHAVCSLIYYCDLGVENTLNKAVNKYEHRFYSMQKIAKDEGIDQFNQLSLVQMMSYWNKAKKLNIK